MLHLHISPVVLCSADNISLSVSYQLPSYLDYSEASKQAGRFWNFIDSPLYVYLCVLGSKMGGKHHEQAQICVIFPLLNLLSHCQEPL